jgi:hypothetical protein
MRAEQARESRSRVFWGKSAKGQAFLADDPWTLALDSRDGQRPLQAVNPITLARCGLPLMIESKWRSYFSSAARFSLSYYVCRL